jgi:peptidyl-prolyl cis-trans isomerase SurA
MTHTMRTHRTRTSLGALAVAALLTLSACGGGSSSEAEPAPSSSSSSSDAPSSAGADLEGVPEVVAEVNGEEVTRDEFAPIYSAQLAQAQAQAQAGGQAPDEEALKKQTLDDLVDTELLAQEADSRGIEVSDDDIDAELTTLAEQNGMKSGAELLDAIAQQGMDEETARDQVETQVMVERLVADEDGPFEPTDKELRTLYAQAAAQAKAGGSGQVPPFAKVRDQLVEQARSQEIGTVAGALVKRLRKDADITVNL